jgi:hypothetical protein
MRFWKQGDGDNRKPLLAGYRKAVDSEADAESAANITATEQFS